MKDIFELINELRRTSFLISFFYFITVIIEIGAITTFGESLGGMAWVVLTIALGLSTVVFLVIFRVVFISTDKLLVVVESEAKRLMKGEE